MTDAATATIPTIVPDTLRKSPRGRKKILDTQGQACPNPDCLYYQIMDATIHPTPLRCGDNCAVIGYGYHGRSEPIHASRFFCQACRRKFTTRRHSALYRLKTPPARVAQVLHAVAEGLSAHAAARVFQLSETTVRGWLSRAGQHSQSLHARFLWGLHLTHVQLDELRLKLCGRSAAEMPKPLGCGSLVPPAPS